MAQDENLTKRIEQLEKENKELNKVLEQHKKDRVDFEAYRIFSKASKMFFGLLSITFVIITLSGIISINSVIEYLKQKGAKSIVMEVKNDLKTNQLPTMIKTIKTEVMADLKEKYLPEIKQNIKDITIKNFQKNYLPDLKNETKIEIISNLKKQHLPNLIQDVRGELITNLSNQLQAEMDETITNNFLPVFRKVAKQIESKEATLLANGLEKSYKEKRYYVIVASSIKRKDLEFEVKDMNKKLGNRINQFPELKILASPDSDYYILIFKKLLPLEESKKLKNEAIKAGFRNDTYVGSKELIVRELKK